MKTTLLTVQSLNIVRYIILVNKYAIESRGDKFYIILEGQVSVLIPNPAMKI